MCLAYVKTLGLGQQQMQRIVEIGDIEGCDVDSRQAQQTVYSLSVGHTHQCHRGPLGMTADRDRNTLVATEIDAFPLATVGLAPKLAVIDITGQ
ncbi:MAG: hypothetical protein KZQ96_03150 [Candidatus Thiodiazotropha sp. (ex Lucinoma borealis)]|nr:hypothetical protein [Candidatus Thiodiazotropha sp. (ex Lucinoma borealis)]